MTVTYNYVIKYYFTYIFMYFNYVFFALLHIYTNPQLL